MTVASDPLMIIDTPVQDATVSAPFTISGWAVNRAASTGTGIDAIHVYAYPATGGSGALPGVGAVGLSRPDVGAALGAQFTNSGWSYTETSSGGGLTYDVVVYARSTVTGTFSVAAVVRITAH